MHMVIFGFRSCDAIQDKELTEQEETANNYREVHAVS